MTTKESFGIFSLVCADKVRIRINTLQILYINTDTYVKEHLEKQIQKMVDEFNKQDLSKLSEEELAEFTHSVSDYYGLSMETKVTLSNYMIVAAFSYYEKGVKQLLSLTGKLSVAELADCYKAKELKKHLKNKFNIDSATIKSFNGIEELRCLNNDIKHNGFAGNLLVASNPARWKLKETIEDTYSDFERLMDAPFEFLKDLADKIKPTL